MEGACCVYFLDLGGTLLGGAEVGGEMGGVWSRGCDTSATNDATAGGGALKGATFFNVAGTPSQDRPTLIAPTDVFRFPSTADGEDGSSELTRAEAYFYGFLRTRRRGRGVRIALLGRGGCGLRDWSPRRMNLICTVPDMESDKG